MDKEKGFQGEYFIVDLDLCQGVSAKFYHGVGTEDWKKYFRFDVYEVDEDSAAWWIKDKYRNYDHFVNVFGKFDPYANFIFEPPKSVLEFNALKKVMEKLDKERQE